MFVLCTFYLPFTSKQYRRIAHKTLFNCILVNYAENIILSYSYFSSYQLLESLLPSRPKQPSPAEDAEEVDLMELDPRYSQKRREAYEDGSDDEAGHGPRVQCAHQ